MKKRNRLHKLNNRLIDHHLGKEGLAWRKQRENRQRRQTLVEQKIQQAMDEGHFDNLPGEGKPLPWLNEPDPGDGKSLAYSLLKRNGFAPEWIERDKDIRRLTARAQAQLSRAWERYGPGPHWDKGVADFAAEVNRINRKIDDLNLIAPAASCQRPRLRLAAEIKKVQSA